MAAPDDRAVRLLLKALRSLTEREREVVLSYLLRRAPGNPIALRSMEELPPAMPVPGSMQFDPVTRMLPVRLPAALHDRLREWSTTHGFSMAAVARGLIERFLDEQDR